MLWPLLRARGLTRASGSRSTRSPSLAFGSCPTYDASQGSGIRRHPSSHWGSGAPRHCTLGVALPAAPLIGSRMVRDTRRQAPPRHLGARGLLGPRVSPSSQPPSPPRRLQKARLGRSVQVDTAWHLACQNRPTRWRPGLLWLHDIATVHRALLQDPHGLWCM
jgi:hypothetical protein